jgi:hypothetical protein
VIPAAAGPDTIQPLTPCRLLEASVEHVAASEVGCGAWVPLRPTSDAPTPPHPTQEAQHRPVDER